MISIRKQLELRQKARENNLKIQIQNSQVISDSVRDMEYGVSPPIIDKRSRSERLTDTFQVYQTALNNSMKLLDNNSSDSQAFLKKVGKNNYIQFNRHFVDIFKKLENQLDYLNLNKIYDYVNSYLSKQTLNNGLGSIIPSDMLLNEVINRLQTDSNVSNTLQTDMLDKLSALLFTIENISTDITKSAKTYTDLDLPNRQEFNDLLKKTNDDFSNELINLTSLINKQILEKLISSDNKAIETPEQKNDDIDNESTDFVQTVLNNLDKSSSYRIENNVSKITQFTNDVRQL
jgi:ribosomal protein L18E